MAAQEDQDSFAIINSITHQDDQSHSTIEETQEPFRASAAEVGKNSFLSSNIKIDECVSGFGHSLYEGNVDDFSRESPNMVEGVVLEEKRDVDSISVAKQDDEFHTTIEEPQTPVLTATAEMQERSQSTLYHQ